MQSRVIKVDGNNPDIKVMREAARLLESGELVAFPTETVYGIGCRAQADSLARLDEVKQRSGDKYYTLHIGQKEDVEKYVPEIPVRARKLIQKGWPGPISIVFELSERDIEKVQGIFKKEVFSNIYKNNCIGIRCPDNQIAAILLQNTVWPIVAPSANLSGRPPAARAEDVLDHFDGKVDLILDGGPCKYKKASTVVKIGKKEFQILRQGVVSKEELHRLSTIKILFVCTGNICRSPMAKGLCEKYLAEKLETNIDLLGEIGYKIDSAGTTAAFGLKASSEAVEFCAEKGVDITAHKSKSLTKDLLQNCDYIFVMCQAHREYVISLIPGVAGKCLLLAGERDIPDPIGGGRQVYEDCGILIEKAVKNRIAELLI